jgi:hypothetical protein
LLSWGVDPDCAGQRRRISWRGWLCHLFAVALFTARAQAAPRPAAVQFALSRLLLEGIDPSTLTPTDLFVALHRSDSGRT